MTYWKRIVLLAVLGAPLAACGGGGGDGVGSIPPPPPAPTFDATQIVATEIQSTAPLPPNPGNTSGTYSAIGIYRNMSEPIEIAPADSTHITVDAATRTYTLSFQPGTTLLSSVRFEDAADSPLGMNETYVYRYSDGSSGPAQTRAVTSGVLTSKIEQDGQSGIFAYLSLDAVGVDTGKSRYVSLGRWEFDGYQTNAQGGYQLDDSEALGYFVFGNRTEPGDLPITGKAAYHVTDSFEVCDQPCTDASGFAISKIEADFGANVIAANYDFTWTHDYYGPCTSGSSCDSGQTRLGTDTMTTSASGSGPINSSGAFDIALAGTGTVTDRSVNGERVSEVTKAVSGTIDGAFFGPQGAEVGGVYSLPVMMPDGTAISSIGAFSAVKTGP